MTEPKDGYLEFLSDGSARIVATKDAIKIEGVSSWRSEEATGMAEQMIKIDHPEPLHIVGNSVSRYPPHHMDNAPRYGETRILGYGGTVQGPDDAEPSRFDGVAVVWWHEGRWCGGYKGEHTHWPQAWLPLPQQPNPPARPATA